MCRGVFFDGSWPRDLHGGRAQPQAEHGARDTGAFHLDPAAHCADELPRYVETEARTGLRVALGHTFEALEDALGPPLRDARPFVGDADNDVGVFLSDRHIDG